MESLYGLSMTCSLFLVLQIALEILAFEGSQGFGVTRAFALSDKIDRGVITARVETMCSR